MSEFTDFYCIISYLRDFVKTQKEPNPQDSTAFCKNTYEELVVNYPSYTGNGL